MRIKMRKKIVSLFLVIVMCLGLFTGCTLFKYDNERDYKQVVATVSSVTITDDSSEENRNNPFVTKEKKIYKYELVSMLNSNGQNLISSGKSLEEAVDYLVDNLVTRELILNEADAQIHFGNIKWGQNEDNQVLEGIYATIDNQLASIRNDILSEHGEETTSTSSSSSSSDSNKNTTYPTKKVEEPGNYDFYTHDELVAEVVERTKGDLSGDALAALETATREKSDYKLRATLENLDLQSVAKWTPDTVRYPGLYGSDDVKSLELEAMRRFLTLLKDTVENDYRVTDDDKKTYLGELDDLNKIADEKGLSYVYPELGDTKIMNFLVGDNYRDNVKLTLLQSHITDSVDVSDEEVLDAYNDTLAAQMSKYANVDDFYTDVKGGSVDPMVYYPNGDYYFVKHILVPFSDDQTARLTAYKNGEGSTYGKTAIAEFKNTLGKEVTGYEHRDGENYGKPLSIDEIYADIQREMTKAGGDLKAADRTFDDLIYKYNTDKGIFGKELGYAVKGALGENEEYDSTYMEEFSRAADELYRAGVEGAISQPVVTDYGVHILYLSRVIPKEGLTVGVNDYISYGENSTVYEKIAESKRSSKTNDEFSVWQTKKVGYYKNTAKVIEKNEKAYDDLKKAKQSN